MSTAAKDIVFVIPGQLQTASEASAPSSVAKRGSVKASVRVGAQRGSGEPVRLSARPGEDVVVLTIANGPTLVLHPEDARDLMHAQAGAGTRSAVAASASGEVVVPPQLGWPGLEAAGTRGVTRGWLGQALLSGFDIVTGLLKDPAVSLAAAAITKSVDGRVEAGVYALSAGTVPESTAGHFWCWCTAPSWTPTAPLASCGRCIRRRCATFLTVTRTASMRSTTQPWAKARSPTR